MNIKKFIGSVGVVIFVVTQAGSSAGFLSVKSALAADTPTADADTKVLPKVSCNADIHVARGNYDEVARIMKSRGLMNADGTLTEAGRNYTGEIFMHEVNRAGKLVGAGEEQFLEGTARTAQAEAEEAAKGLGAKTAVKETTQETTRIIKNSAKTGTCSADDAIIARMIQRLNSSEYGNVLGSESVGGNAGPGRAAVNAYVNRATGEIVAFGNIQNLPTSVTQNPANAHVTFTNDIGVVRVVGNDVVVEGGGQILGVTSRDLANPEALARLKAEMSPKDFAQFLERQGELKKTLALLKKAIDVKNSSKGASVAQCAPKAPCPIDPSKATPSQPYPIGPKVSESIVRNALNRIGQFFSIGTREGFIRSVLNSIKRGIKGGLWGAINPLNIAAIMATEYPEVMSRIDFSQFAIDETDKQLSAKSRKLLSLSVQLSEYYEKRNDLSDSDFRTVRNLKGFYDEALADALADAVWLDIKSKELYDYTKLGGSASRAMGMTEAFGERWNFEWQFDDLSHCRKSEVLPCLPDGGGGGGVPAGQCTSWDTFSCRQSEDGSYAQFYRNPYYGQYSNMEEWLPANNQCGAGDGCMYTCYNPNVQTAPVSNTSSLWARSAGACGCGVAPAGPCSDDVFQAPTGAQTTPPASGGSTGAPPTPPQQQTGATRSISVPPAAIAAARNASGRPVTLPSGDRVMFNAKTGKILVVPKDGTRAVVQFTPPASGKGVSVKVSTTAAPKTPTTSKPPTTGILRKFDFGDGPATTPTIFPTLLRQNGIRHASGDIVTLGNMKTVEVDALTRPNTSQDDMDQDDAPPTETANGGVQVLVRSSRNKQPAFLNVAVDANANGRIEPNEWRVRNQRVVIARAGVSQQVLLRGLRYQALLEKWVRVTVTTVGIKNYNGTGAKKDGETEDWFVAAVPPADCSLIPIPQCAPGTELMTGRDRNNCPVYACRQTSAPPGAPAPAGSKGAVGPSSQHPANSFLGALLKAFGR